MFTDAALSDSDRKAIHDFALDARDVLTTEARDLLEGVYGLKADASLEPLGRLPNLTGDREGQETYKRLSQALDDEVKAGLDRREAVDKLVKEIAFTHLNRLVAFKMMETRRLIRQAVGRGRESNGFKFYLADQPDEEALWQTGDVGAETAYRHFLLWQCAQVAREIRVLFDPATLASRLFPRPNALREALTLLNDESLAGAWASAETIGWVYQYFNERELQAAFAAARTKGVKFEAADIPSVTQLFTQRWIVRLLVENTLGRTWLAIHPDSRLKDELRYLVPLAPSPLSREASRSKATGPIGREARGEGLRLARDITLLDPACGTMHFGLVAFDLFAEMYREELDRAGEPGWPERPSAPSEADIPAAILAYNLFGIDIDLRAVQLAALTLYLKAKELNKDTALTASNLACADVLALNGERLNDFLREMNFQKPAYERLIRALWARLKDINQLGSLLRLEGEIESLVAEERMHFEKEGRQPDLFGAGIAFEDEAAQSEYWAIVEAQLIQAFDEFARRATQHGDDETFFAGEAAKGLRVLDLMLRRYDCVTTNPPYMSRRKMNNTLAELLDDQYPEGKGDLYAAFIQRVLEFASERGYTGMLTMHSFMFISSYGPLRQLLTGQMVIETVAHLGGGLFATGNPGTLQTAAFVLRRQLDSEQRDAYEGAYFRLVHEPDSDSKQAAFEHALADGSNTYRVQQYQFKAIPSEPWAYWVSSHIREVFQSYAPLATIGVRPNPGNSSDNFRFLRLHWEIKPDDYGPSKNWITYSKGGGYRKWFGNLESVINWTLAARKFYREDFVARITDEEFWYREAITYSSIGSSGLSARYLPPLGVYDRGGPAIIFQENILTRSGLAILNSNLVSWILGLLNPSINFQGGDLDRIPFPSAGLLQNSIIAKLSTGCIHCQLANSLHDEITFRFNSPSLWATGLQDLAHTQARLVNLESQINDEVYRLYGISDEDRTAIEAELSVGGSVEGEAPEEESQAPGNDDEAGSDGGMTRQELAVRWVSFAIGIVLGRFKPGVAGELGSAVYRREDFAIGSLPAPDEAEFDELVGEPERFAYIDANGGRHIFSAEAEARLRALADNDGITVLDEGHRDDLPAKVDAALELMLGEKGAVEVVEAIMGEAMPVRDGLRWFFEREFFNKWHVKWYRKRPIYWLLQSPKKLYGIYLFHERLTKDTLFVVQRNYLDLKLNLTRQTLAEKRADAAKAGSARERKALNKEADEVEKLLVDLEEFGKRLAAITRRGYDPDINDGVILNLAPLWEVIPAWSKEPQKYWEGLERGDYDWAHMAMNHWPERVKKKCKTDKSLAIAHGIEQR